jgi:hypothetical protein
MEIEHDPRRPPGDGGAQHRSEQEPQSRPADVLAEHAEHVLRLVVEQHDQRADDAEQQAEAHQEQHLVQHARLLPAARQPIHQAAAVTGAPRRMPRTGHRSTDRHGSADSGWRSRGSSIAGKNNIDGALYLRISRRAPPGARPPGRLKAAALPPTSDRTNDTV